MILAPFRSGAHAAWRARSRNDFIDACGYATRDEDERSATPTRTRIQFKPLTGRRVALAGPLLPPQSLG